MSRDRLDDDRLERELRALATQEAFPATPDLAAQVRERIEREGIRPAPVRWSFGLPPIRRSLAFALLALIALAGTVIAASLVIGGLRIRFVDQLPSVPPTVSTGPSQAGGPGAGLNLGRRVGLVEARDLVDFQVPLPTDPGLGRPDAVYVSTLPPGGMVSLVWGPGEGRPERLGGVSILVSHFRAGLDPGHFEKLVHSGSTVERTEVGGTPAYWISGAPHAFLYVGPDGQTQEQSLRLVGSTLVWEEGGIVSRIEGASSLEDALRMASTIR